MVYLGLWQDGRGDEVRVIVYNSSQEKLWKRKHITLIHVPLAST